MSPWKDWISETVIAKLQKKVALAGPAMNRRYDKKCLLFLESSKNDLYNGSKRKYYMQIQPSNILVMISYNSHLYQILINFFNTDSSLGAIMKF